MDEAKNPHSAIVAEVVAQYEGAGHRLTGELIMPFADAHVAAARGITAAQSALAAHFTLQTARGVLGVAEGLALGEVFTRLAAASGGVTERKQLGTFLTFRSHVIRSLGLGPCPLYEEQALDVFNRLAEEGDEGAAADLVSLSEVFQPESVAQVARKAA